MENLIADQQFMTLLSPDRQRALRAIGRPGQFRAGDTLLHAGQVGDRVMVILAGRAKISYTTEGGREVVLRFAGPGEVLGELAVIDGRPRSGTIEAVEPVETLTVGASDFLTFVNDDPDARLALLRTLSARCRDSDQKRIQFGAADSVGRISLRLLELAERFGEPADDGVAITLPLTQEELGSWCGCSREAVAKGLQALRRQGAIETSRRRILVRDLDGLRRRGGLA
jgi:CRP/FNR family transcriptional regulator, cyclic AMP receptor protein